jgi:predicted dehydrogenase
MLRIGVMGYGYWGPNIVRNFTGNKDARVTAICDTHAPSRERAQRANPALRVTADPNEILTSPDIDAVAIITPAATHYPLAKQALNNGKHVFVAKPFTTCVDHAQELIDLATKHDLTVMVDHTFLFTGAVRKIRELIDDNVLGQLYYYDSVRVNLGLFRGDTNVAWDLAPHDLSIMDYLIRERPSAVVATGERHVNGVEDVAYITVYFPNKIIAHFNVNWLSPVKVRTTLIGAEKRMLVWNDLEPDEKIKIYDKGVETNSREGEYELMVSYRTGDMWAPKIEQVEALKLETQYFVDCIANHQTPHNDGHAGLRVVQLLEAVDRSLKRTGDTVYV